MISIKLAAIFLAFCLVECQDRNLGIYANRQGIGIKHSGRYGNTNLDARLQRNWNSGLQGSLGFSRNNWGVNVNAGRDSFGIKHSGRYGNTNLDARLQRNWNGGFQGSLGLSRNNWGVNVNAGRDRFGHANVGIGFKYRFKRDLQLGAIPSLPCSFSVYDANSDGNLRLDEFEAQLQKRHYKDKNTLFKVMDVNSDGLVTEEEFMTVAIEVANDLLFPECYQGKKKSG